MKKLTLVLLLLSSVVAWGQKTFPTNGVYDHREGKFAFKNATVHVSPERTLENATLIIEDGKVKSVSTSSSTPKDAVVYDMKGKHIYPSFIEVYSDYGMPEPHAEGKRHELTPQMVSNKDGAYAWNEVLKTEFRADAAFKSNDKAAEALRKLGFGAVVTHKHDGMSRGSSALISLGDDREHELILKGQVAHHLSFSKGTSTQSYPSSLMGGIALFRQTYLDGKWYSSSANQEEYNLSLQAWNDLQSLPQVFEVKDRLDILRASKIGQEFGKKYIVKGTGDEYMRIDAIKKTGSPLIIPVDYPKAYDVSDAFDAEQIGLADMKHWELAPTNAAAIAKAGIPFAFTTEGLKSKSDLLKNIKLAIKNGLSKKDALAALTSTPAKLMKIDKLVGTLENGKIANFIITDNDLFEEEKATIHQNWVAGQGFVLQAFSQKSPIGQGVYNLSIGGQKERLEVELKEDKPTYKIAVNDTTKIDVKQSFKDGILTLSFNKDGKTTRLTGTASSSSAKGQGYNADGKWITWSVNPTRATLDKKEEKKKEDKKKEEDKAVLGDVTYPFLPYGWKEQPKAKTTLIKNATLWTNEKDGIIEADILLSNGKISKVGKDLGSRADVVIDAKGKHVTSGIIDEHSHIAISRGVNEGTQASSSEVRIGDVVNSEDVNIYRNLAGGVVAAQLLHGSANPIGGQSGIIKMRWGSTPEEMQIKNAAPFIKFALGENVKQSNWGDSNIIRFPQTRMGVEQVYMDYFTRALEYKKLKNSGKPYRRDLDLEPLLGIIEKKRFISCHSYVQSEINMLMKVAEHFGFTLNTFTHILEGYKVADKMKEHGAGGSTFSDWWAYKYEVIDAIPYNAAILNAMDIVTAINSDDAEMSRRLNQEAAKSVMYGGMSEEDAWKMITLNPAKLLHLDSHMGSLKAGKDADIVIWSDNPLSIYAKVEQTFVDGKLYFDIQRDEKLRQEIREERNRLTQKMLNAKNNGAATQPPSKRHKHHYHCDHTDDEMGNHIHLSTHSHKH